MDGTKDDIMEATFRALSEHGYADLSIKNIADEAEMSKSSIYYHYDDKEDLILAFLDFLKEHIRRMHEEVDGEEAEDKLDVMLDMALGIKNEEQWMVHRALLDLRAQAPRNDVFAEKFREIDDMVAGEFEEMMKELGAEKPRTAAEILVSCIQGAAGRKVSTGDREGLAELKEGIKSVVEENIES